MIQCLTMASIDRFLPCNIGGMRIRYSFLVFSLLSFVLAGFSSGNAQASGQASSSSSSSSTKHSAKAAAESRLDAGAVKNGIYRNAEFGFACKIPVGWVLRTEEMNASDKGEAAETSAPSREGPTTPDRTAGGSCPYTGCGHVLLATFSRPPEARGEDVNSSIVIAVESVAAYPGLKEAAQYFGPVTEIAQARGFEIANEPYEFTVGTKNLARGDFQEDVGKRVLMQSTLVMLARGYAVSFTFIGGTEDEIEELIGGLSFAAGAKAAAH
jgi:hypothetical protein